MYVDTRSRHETMLLRDYDRSELALTNERNVVWRVDRAFIDAPFGDAKKRTLGSTIMTRMKRNLRVDSSAGLPVNDDRVNAGIEHDLRVTLASAARPWRIITVRTRRGHVVEFLTNDFDLQPGLIAFLYARRWDEEKCFDTWKNDCFQTKAWGKSVTAIDNQVRLAIITSLLVALLLSQALGAEAMSDAKALRKQDDLQESGQTFSEYADGDRVDHRETKIRRGDRQAFILSLDGGCVIPKDTDSRRMVRSHFFTLFRLGHWISDPFLKTVRQWGASCVCVNSALS